MIKECIKKIPGTQFFWNNIRKIRFLFDFSDTENVFTKIYKSNSWKGVNSISGPGSDNTQTEHITKVLPELFCDLGIKSLLDIPCGDFNWMRNVDLSSIHYIGGDIVEEIIAKNKEQFQNKDLQFEKLNLLIDNLPKVDMIMCRDCLVHFSYKDIFVALKNICNSESTYFLSTIFTNQKSNHNIVTGEWRPLNLTLPPFNLPLPLNCINEKCTEGNGLYSDKSLGLWKISDISAALRA